MSAVGHTPGPWLAEPADFFGDHNIRQADTGNIAAVAAVVSNLRDPEEVAANARLITAAPDLLEIITRLIKWDKDYSWNGYAGLKALDAIIADGAAITAKITGDNA